MEENSFHLILKGKSDSLDNNPRYNRIEYSLHRSENLPSRFGFAVASFTDGHYVLWEMWKGDDARYLGLHEPRNIIGVAHTTKEADRRIYNRMNRRALRIAKKEEIRLERDLDAINLEPLIKAFA